MDADVMAMLDRVERLAFQAGIGAGGKAAPPTPAPPDGTAEEPALTPAEKEVLRRLRAVAKACPGNLGVALFAVSIDDNLEWSHIYALNS